MPKPRRTQATISAEALAKRMRSGYIAEVLSQEQVLHYSDGYTPESLAGYTAHLKGKIPSVNILTLDVHETKRRVSTKEVKWFKTSVINLFRDKRHLLPESKFYNLRIIVGGPIYAADGSIRKWDASNFVKVAEDALCQAFGYDDSRNKTVIAEKVNQPEWEWSFILTTTDSP